MGRRQREWEDREWFPPGPQLAICLSGRKERLADLTDDELLQFAAAARRQTSWAQARELAAVAELSRRRADAETAGDPDYRILSAHDSVTEEVAAALTITGNAAATLVHLSERLAGALADTAAALEAGRIDMSRARVICEVTDDMPDQVTRQLQTAALEKAPGQTTGQLRRRIKRIAQRLAPAAAEERKREAVRARRLELWDTPAGTADLALCDLPPEDAHAIYNKITAAAHGLKKDGDPRPLPQLRADLTTLLLKGAELPTAVQMLLADPPQPCDAPANAAPHPDDTDATSVLGLLSPPPQDHSPQSVHGVQSRWGVRGARGADGHRDPHPATAIESVLVKPPAPGLKALPPPPRPPQDGRPQAIAIPDVRGTGQGAITRALAGMVEHRLTHVRDRVAPHVLPAAIVRAVQSIHDELAPARDAVCQGRDESHGRPGYRPPDALRRDILTRHATCVFPTCNRDARRCDLDHTIPWRPGTTCHCNLAPLCRRHHRLKQTPGWTLHQIWPGLMIWTTPSGGWYVVHPDRE
ncbi:HNH endonuclease signature motif containing protein [Actinomadura chokoriensis]|uniref:HNH endonuclease signature motif containing protein n=1 Tax=Actinomadura chokoriensis TaxID=454156 RepID=UPI0031F8F986